MSYKIAIVLLIIVAGVGVYLLYSPSKTDNNAVTPPISGVDFETIAKNVTGGLREQRNYVITTNSDWKTLWERISSDPLPTVDFKKETLLAFFQGQQSTGGYSVEITNLKEGDKEIETLVIVNSPGPNCLVTEALTEPYHIIKTKKFSKDIIFRVEQKVVEC